MATIAAAFGLLAAILATIGVYGVIAYGVARRTRELGVRMALGADRRRIVRLVVGEGLALVGVGLAIGAPLAFGAMRAAAALLHGIAPHDPLTFALAAALLALVAILACLLPARRAASIDPMVALRDP